MLKMYKLTVIFAVAVWAVIVMYFSKSPIQDHEIAVSFYGVMLPLTIHTFWWNMLSFRKLRIPHVFEVLRIPLAATALGINSAYYHIRFTDPEAQRLLETSAVKNLWLGFEVVLIIILIIGIYRWEKNYNKRLD